MTSARMGGMVLGRIADGLVHELAAVARSPLERRRLARVAPTLTEDPLDPALIADAPAWWQSLHERGPVHYSRRRAFWIINGHDEVQAALRAHDVLSSADGVIRTRERLPMMLTIDRPDHTRLRRLVARDFTNERLSATKPRIDELARDGIAAMLNASPADPHAQLAGPLPIEIIADLLGIPEDDRPDFRTWSDEIVEAMAIGVGESPLTPRAFADYYGTIRSATKLLSFFDTLTAQRRREPGDDLISALARSEQEGGLTNGELFWFMLLLLVAGNETTTGLISGLLLALATNPAEYERLREEPALIPAAVEEGLRWTSPVQAFFREARAPHEVAGVTIPAGSRVMLAFGAANHDPTVYESPDEFRLDRARGAKHLAFGSGIHFCLGAHLARLEATGVLEQLVRRVETIELAGPVEWTRNPSLRQIKRLPLRLA